MLKGYYQDTLTDAQGKLLWKGRWRANAIVRSCDQLLAALLNGDDDLEGVQFWAVGEGLQSWDGHSSDINIETTHLSKEITRKTPQIEYLNGRLDILEVEVEFEGDDLVSDSGVQSLREFGLFGGNATNTKDSGYLIDYVIHPRIDLVSGNTLTRRLRLSFNTSVVSAPAFKSRRRQATFGDNLTIAKIEGIGTRFTQVLHAHGIKSVGELAALDCKTAQLDIPVAKLKEFHTKANLILRRQSLLDPDQLEPFENYSLIRFLNTHPVQLAKEADTTLEAVTNIQDTLTDLQIALGNDVLETITLNKLME